MTTWPTYPHAPDLPGPLARHNSNMTSGPKPGPMGLFGAAIDVWRDGAHLWRSYDLTKAETPADWSERTYRPTLGDAWPKDHGRGPWAILGRDDAWRWPIPKLEAMQHIGSAPMLCDLIATVLAIGQLPGAPEGLDTCPQPGAIGMAMKRHERTWFTVTAEAAGVSLRALVGYVDPPKEGQPDMVPVVPFRATLERRTVRAGAVDGVLPEGRQVFYAPADTEPHMLARRAKAALGITGHGAARLPGQLVWNVARAPYVMTVAPLTEAELVE
jgi:hypothetical protein